MKPDDIEQRVCERLRSLYGEAAAPLIADISQRQAFGVAKYGVRLADNPAPLAARLRHMLEELLDAAVYAEWIRDGYSPKDRMWDVLEEREEEEGEALPSSLRDVRGKRLAAVGRRALRRAGGRVQGRAGTLLTVHGAGVS